MFNKYKMNFNVKLCLLPTTSLAEFDRIIWIYDINRTNINRAVLFIIILYLFEFFNLENY